MQFVFSRNRIYIYEQHFNEQITTNRRPRNLVVIEAFSARTIPINWTAFHRIEDTACNSLIFAAVSGGSVEQLV